MRRELGSHKPDFEDWFLMWNSVLFYPNPALRESQILLVGHSGESGSIPAHQHKACGGMVKAETPYPPRVCPHCHVDTLKEFQMQPEEKRNYGFSAA